MAVHSKSAAAPGRVVSARFPLREVVTIVGVVFTATSALIVGMQWAITNNLGPLFLAMQSIESHVLSTRKEVNVLHADVAVLRGEVGGLRGLRADVADLRTEFRELRAEVSANRGQITGLRERATRVETGLEQVQAHQVRMLDISGARIASARVTVPAMRFSPS